MRNIRERRFKYVKYGAPVSDGQLCIALAGTFNYDALNSAWSVVIK